MNADDEICYCFHVTRRKLENFARRQRPAVTSQMSECGGAGTGCGWCIPFLMQIHRHAGSATQELETLSAAEYAQKRSEYVVSGKGVPAAGATPLPGEADEKVS